MFKTKVGNEYWMVTHPDHMELAGYLAAHWGNRDFLPMGAPFRTDAESKMHSNAVWSVANHDNGWWEWEAEPRLDEKHHLPVDLTEVLADLPDALGRWRIGTVRFERSNPFGSALIAHHALNLYKPRLDEAPDENDVHPLFWKHLPPVADRERSEVAEFVNEMALHKAKLLNRISEDSGTAHWADAESVALNGRLIQVLDAIAIYLSSGLMPGLDDVPVEGYSKYAWNILRVPRSSASDRVMVEVRAAGERRLKFGPYPFDIDPLPVLVPIRVSAGFNSPADRDRHWHGIERRILGFEITS